MAVNVYHVISLIASRLGNGLPTPAALTIPAFAVARLVQSSRRDLGVHARKGSVITR